MKVSFILSTLLYTVYSKPNGAPKCAINDEAITKGMGPQTPDLGYKITASSKNGLWSFTVENPTRKDFQGVLLYVTSSANPKAHLGKFSGLDMNKFKFQTASVCAAGNFTGALEATVTHANPKRVPVGTSFQWSGSVEERSMPNVVLNAVIASLDDGATGKPKWHHLPDLPFDCAPGMNNPRPTGPVYRPPYKAPKPQKEYPPTGGYNKPSGGYQKPSYEPIPNTPAPTPNPGTGQYEPQAPSQAPAPAPGTSDSEPVSSDGTGAVPIPPPNGGLYGDQGPPQATGSAEVPVSTPGTIVSADIGLIPSYIAFVAGFMFML
ncbi:hypothetical protein BC833DRAFT_601889, partial [Globomyces pollinis-pini]